MRIIVTALAVVACWNLAGAQEKKVEPHVDKQREFSIQFPANAKVKTDNKNTKDGAPMHAVIAECGQGKTCVVIYLDVPDVNKQPQNIDAFFEAAKKEAGKNGEVKNRPAVDRLPEDPAACEFDVVRKDGQMLRTRLLIYKTRTYTLIFSADAKNFPAEEAKKFFESFTWLKK